VQERSQLLLMQRGDDVWITESGVVWVPHDAAQMQVRLCVVAHFGIIVIVGSRLPCSD
jgi:hypothetical protein